MDPVTAFVMASIALALTAVNILVTITLFRKSAGRVNVQMDASVLSPGRSLVTNNTGGWGIDTPDYIWQGIEAIRVSVENPGRIGATITKVELRFEGSVDSDLAMTLNPLEIHHRGETLRSDTPLVSRLEPFDEVVYLFDFWQAIDHIFETEPELRAIRVYASVKVAGQDESYDSKKHGYWTVRREWVTFRAPYTRRTIESIVLSELTQASQDPTIYPYLVDLSTRIVQRMSPESSATEITEILQEISLLGKESKIFEEGINIWSVISFGSRVKRRITILGDGVIWTTSKAPSKSTSNQKPG